MIELRGLFQTPLLFQGGQGHTYAIESRHILLELAPRAHKRNGTQVIQSQRARLFSPGWTARNVGGPIMAQGSIGGQVFHERRMGLQLRVGRITAFRQEVHQSPLILCPLRLFWINQTVLQSGRQQQLHVVGCTLRRPKIGTNGLPLNGGLHLFGFHVRTERCVEPMCVSTTARWRPTSAIKKDHLHTKISTRCRQGLFRLVNGPIRHQIPSVLGAVAKSQHHVLNRFARIQVISVGVHGQQAPHF